MTHPSSDEIAAFGVTFGGRTLIPGHADYDRSRSIWNGAIDRKPAVIACCTTAKQVSEAIRFARRSGLAIAVRGGATATPAIRYATGG